MKPIGEDEQRELHKKLIERAKQLRLIENNDESEEDDWFWETDTRMGN